MLAGHLQEKGGKYYAVLNCKHHVGKRFPKWVPTDLPVKKGNKRPAEKKLDEFRGLYNEYGEQISEIVEIVSPSIPEQSCTVVSRTGDMLFADYMLYWLSYKETEVDPVTFAGYCDSVENHIYPYFKELGLTLSQLEPKHLREFYKFERIGDPEHGKGRKKGTTVVRYHSNIHNALEVAAEDGLVGKNAAHKQRPKTDKFIGSFYLPEEALECIRLAGGTWLEIAVLFGLFYGLRRSEIVGLKWQNFDFERNLFTIAHTVTTYYRKGQTRVSYAKDKTKNKSSMRTLPLIPLFREKLLALKEQQKEHRRLFGNSYNRKYLGYIYVNEIGELIKPDYISSTFKKFLEKNGLRHIRFHDTRHSCASLLLRNGVSMKEIQAWLGIATMEPRRTFMHTWIWRSLC
ncbi:Site-specific recombinase XerD [Anaerocolumna jejuensis DSM 15929]|uniref:Site-specific recombinase XerD n=1 Tax=Anaerocolumna jejuensis DSM 15929 TaxID=1121322 RepID=A0A1M6ZMA8_9FIRM|nr:site-specific integrase [Anaerocolumna jejuensis]SHL31534.1 Site-specific recombinase XerD [Anaerocolumna jejuensis DSM 15929]